MIYTVTFNPSLDYVVQAEQLVPGEINRTTSEAVYPGGKGVNVSVILSNLGLESTAFGFTAGFTGKALQEMLLEFGAKTDFIPLADGQTRINVKINAGQETEINGQGPKITETAIQELFEKLKSLKAGDVLVLAGSIPSTLPENIYEWILMCLKDKDVKVVVDATKDLLLNVLKYHPFLIKPNNHELGEMFGVTLKTDEEIITYAKKLQEKGAGNVLISMAGDGAILITEDGEIHKGLPPKGEVVNSVGAGDSMVAGFLTGYLNTGDYEKAFKLGIATGSATAFLAWLAEKEDVVKLLDEAKENFGL
jgi:1-phosphofructokinase